VTRQEWLDGLKVGDEVAIEYRGRGSKVFRVEAITSRDGHEHERFFLVGGLMFTATGMRFNYEGYEEVPGFCSLEDPDVELLDSLTRREVSRRWHIEEVFTRIMNYPELTLSYDQLEKMIKVVYPDYEPVWKL
jgi:hypothetical protein